MTGNMIGRTFNNRYKITDRIGIGGMAEVYRAQDTVLGRIVAVKTMLPQYAADPNFTQRFRQEAAAAANLQSPYIVNVYDWGQDEGTYYIVMEYVRGSDLKTAIKERGAINQRKVAEIGSQVCQALAAAHNLDIVHRDIKPQNIMVQPDGNVKVMDFGIARAKNSVMTQTSSVLGTAHYISPEQAQGKELTSTSDIYSLGIVLYEAATGKLPFDGPDAVSVAMKQVNDLPAPPHTLNPDIDPSLEDIIMKALEKQPQNRFSTANDMRFALNDFLAGRPVVLGDGFAHAETAILGGMAGTAAAEGLENGTAVMPVIKKEGTPNNYRSTTDPKKKGPNKKTVGIVVGVIVALLAIAGITFALLNNPGTGEAVPDITGKTIEEATRTLEDAGFKVGTQSTVYSDNVEVGKIISQDPRAGSKAEKGSKVNCVISSGREEITVPDLTAKTAEEAKRLLEPLGLKASAGTAEYSSSVDVNLIIRQDPPAGSKAHKGDTVTYILSLGAATSSVPDVTGKSRNDAIATLENAGFHVSEGTPEYSKTVAEGRVIRQNPNSGIKAENGSTVTITVSKGVEPEPEVTVPKVVGLTVSVATAKLQDAGFNVDAPDSEGTELVKTQSPASGAKAKNGATITLTFEKATQQTTPKTP